jgi:PIN domain nuclease of toxin-antitoxin system
VILFDTHIWVRWVDAEANPLPPGLVETIETADRLAVSAIAGEVVVFVSTDDCLLKRIRNRADIPVPGTVY